MKTLGLVLSAAIFGAAQAEAATLRVTAEIESLHLTMDRLQVLWLLDDPTGVITGGGLFPGSDEYASVIDAFHPLSGLKQGDLAVLDFNFPGDITASMKTNVFTVSCVSGIVCTNGGAASLLKADDSGVFNLTTSAGRWELSIFGNTGAWITQFYSFSQDYGGVSGLGDALCCGNFGQLNGKQYFWIEPQASVSFTNVTIEGLPSPVPLPASILFLALPIGILLTYGVKARGKIASS